MAITTTKRAEKLLFRITLPAVKRTRTTPAPSSQIAPSATRPTLVSRCSVTSAKTIQHTGTSVTSYYLLPRVVGFTIQDQFLNSGQRQIFFIKQRFLQNGIGHPANQLVADRCVLKVAEITQLRLLLHVQDKILCRLV
uniref:(northern house mosquito) hypothetical protein n=1 Tax=Culex pipiens TaxID=7175 RepID=A0A8D8G1B0_CULPI